MPLRIVGAEEVHVVPLLIRIFADAPAEVSPVPPFAVATVPVTFDAVPLMLPLIVLENVFVPAIVCAELRSTYVALKLGRSLAWIADEAHVVPLLRRTLPVTPDEVMPVPPCDALSAVVRPESEVISLFAPDAAAPRFVRAPAAVVAFVPPFATATVPVTLEAVPLMLPLIVLENVFVPAMVCEELRSTYVELRLGRSLAWIAEEAHVVPLLRRKLPLAPDDVTPVPPCDAAAVPLICANE